MNSSWVKISLIFFSTIALIGTLIRAFPYFDISFNYSHLIHAHSHVAFQGWIYTLILLLVTSLFLTKGQIQRGRYALQFKLTIPIIFGILVSFALQGYGLYSIVFSTLFQVLNYWFIFRFFRDSKHTESTKRKDISLRFVKMGLWLGLISTIAPYAVGVLSAKGLANTEAYNAAIYFFLHFQYNGWFLFVALGLLFKCMEIEQIYFNRKGAGNFFLLFAIAVIPAYALSLLGMSFRDLVIVPAILAALLQVVGLIIFFPIVRQIIVSRIFGENIWIRMFLLTVFASFTMKICLQFLSLFPILENYAFGSRNLIMAYMHLSLIGVISFLFIAMLIYLGWLKMWWPSKIGSTFLLCGFFVTEIVLVLSGLGWIQLHFILLIFSAMMAIGILTLLFSTSKQ